MNRLRLSGDILRSLRCLGHLHVLCLAGQAFPATLIAQRATLSGSVTLRAEMKPVVGAELLIPELRLTTRTNWGGDFEIKDIPAGEHEVFVRKLGFKSVSMRLRFAAAAVVQQDFVLDSEVVVLDSMHVNATQIRRGRLGEFDERRALAIGFFLTREYFEKNSSRRFSEILTAAPGAAIRRNTAGDAWLLGGRGTITILTRSTLDPADIKRGATPGCYASVWIDGVMVYGGRDKEPLFNVNTLAPDQIEGLEFYAGGAQLPTRYSGSNSACGVLLIWTRE